jgi:hypothetical protein
VMPRLPTRAALLHAALEDAKQQADACTRFCRLASTANDHTLEVFHNGIGASDSDHQVIWTEHLTDPWNTDLRPLFVTWLVGLHQDRHVDLNVPIVPSVLP